MKAFSKLLVAGCAMGVGAIGLSNSLDALLPPQAANIRFINRLPDNASVSLNGAGIFTQVAPGTLTGWRAVRDSTVTLTITRGTSDTIRATTTTQLVNSSYYTISASAGNEGGVLFSVIRDNGAEDTTNISRPMPPKPTQPATRP